jgi:hypothetical protein
MRGVGGRWFLVDWPRHGYVYRLEGGVWLAVVCTGDGRHVSKLNDGEVRFFTKLKLAKWWLEQKVK